MSASISEEGERTILEALLLYLSIMRRYKWFIIFSTLIITAGTAVICVISLKLPPEESFLPNFYTAQANILIQQRAQDDISSIILANLDIPISTTARGFDYGQQIIALATSRTVVDELISKFELDTRYEKLDKSELRDFILSQLSFNYSTTTAIMQISYTDIDPEQASNMVNELISLLQDWYNTSSNDFKTNQRQVLEEKLTEVKKDIERLSSLIKRIPEIDPAYPQYTAELEIQQRIYNTLFPQYEAARLVPESQPIFQVFEQADIPDTKSGPSRSRFVMLALLGSFIGSAGLSLGLNALKSFRNKNFHI